MCQQEMDLSEFNKKGAGVQPLCRSCNKERSRAYYVRNKDLHKQNASSRNQRQRKTNQDYVKNLKESSPCMDCGQFYPYYVMDFDHLSDKRSNVSRMVSGGLSLETIKIEIDKCDLVCANCHRARTFRHL
jgi:hypothetical protein